MNCIAVLICPELHLIASKAIQKLRQGQGLKKWHENVKLWPSIFSGIEVISNRITPDHRDGQSAPPVYDFLVSAGTHKEAWLDLPDLEAKLSYKPCTVIAISGKVLRHGVKDWEGGERICVAHFIRDAVHNRLQLPRPGWVNMADYRSMMAEPFLERQQWMAEMWSFQFHSISHQLEFIYSVFHFTSLFCIEAKFRAAVTNKVPHWFRAPKIIKFFVQSLLNMWCGFVKPPFWLS